MRRAGRGTVLVVRVALFVAVLVFIEVAPRLGWIDSLTLVPLSTMVEALLGSVASGEILPHLATTGAMILMSFVLASVTGVAGGYLLWRFRVLRTALDPYLTSFYALPVFAFYPVLIAIFGLSHVPVVLLGWAYASIAVVTNTAIGLSSVKRVHLKTAAVYGLSRGQTLRRVQAPAAASHIFTGLRLAGTYSVIGVIASELILATQGLGWLVSFSYESFDLAAMYAAILLVMAVAFLVTTSLTATERRLWPRERGRWQ